MQLKDWNNEDEMFFTIRQKLYSAVIGDILDQHGYTHQFLPPEIRPLRDKMVVVGRALTVVESDINQVTDEKISSKIFGVMLEALDDLRKNEVYICTGSSHEYALWGELMSTRAVNLGCTGVVVDGYLRDTNAILAIGFPCFSCGSYAQDQAVRGKVVDYRVPIKFGQVLINPGDIILGDIDGVCVIPREVEDEIIMAALEKARMEKIVKSKLESGLSACEAFATYKVI